MISLWFWIYKFFPYVDKYSIIQFNVSVKEKYFEGDSKMLVGVEAWVTIIWCPLNVIQFEDTLTNIAKIALG